MSEKLLSFSAVARKIGVTRPTLYAWKEDGRFNVAPHQSKRWRESDIEAWIKDEYRPDQFRMDGI